MSKRTSAKAYFEAQGRSAASRGLPLIINRGRRVGWPDWARQAWARGWIMQPSPRQNTERILSSFERGAAANGRTLREEVEHFLDGASHG